VVVVIAVVVMIAVVVAVAVVLVVAALAIVLMVVGIAVVVTCTMFASARHNVYRISLDHGGLTPRRSPLVGPFEIVSHDYQVPSPTLSFNIFKCATRAGMVFSGP
jgi:hypothetical protein